MFRGRHTATVDAKGRLKMPAEFKAEADQKYGPDFYITSQDGNAARIYPMPVWNAIEEKLARLPSLNKSKRKFLDRANYYGQAVRMDGQGRVLIPAQLRETAALRGEVAVIGYLDYLDVWSTARFAEQLERNPITDEDERILSDLGI